MNRFATELMSAIGQLLQRLFVANNDANAAVVQACLAPFAERMDQLVQRLAGAANSGTAGTRAPPASSARAVEEDAKQVRGNIPVLPAGSKR